MKSCCHYSRIQFYVIIVGYKRDVLNEINLLSSRQICISSHYIYIYVYIYIYIYIIFYIHIASIDYAPMRDQKKKYMCVCYLLT